MSNSNLINRTIFCKDNLDILKKINSNCVDLIYLDPPFNKKKTFSAPIGSAAEGASFKDTFREEDIKDEWVQSIKEDYVELHNFLSGTKLISSNKFYLYNYCYLCYMAIRLLEMQRILKDTGTIYLHCDNTMGHYIKILMDIIFGEKNFRNSVIWFYETGGIPKKDFSRKHDIIFRYSKSNNYTFNSTDVLEKRSDEVLRRIATGNKNATRSTGEYRHPSDVFKIPGINAMAKERTNYPTQKPLALLEKIIKASSKEGDFVLDPFCGCATTCVASEKLKRKWVGIDVSEKAYELVQKRLKEEVYNPEDILQYQIEVNFTTTPPRRTDRNEHDLIQKYVYIISHPIYRRENLYKVGIATNFRSRLNSYQTGDPNREYEEEFKLRTPHFREIEGYIHNRFRFSHEWVKGNLADIRNAIENFSIEHYNQINDTLPL